MLVLVCVLVSVLVLVELSPQQSSGAQGGALDQKTRVQLLPEQLVIGGVSWDDQAVGRQHRRRGSVGGAANMATAWCWCWACERSAKCEVERWGPGP